MNNAFYNEKNIQAQRQKIYNQAIMNVIKEMKLSPETPYVVLQQALLSTSKAHDANQAINAAALYIKTGRLDAFTGKEQARFNMNNYKSVLTPEVTKKFIDYAVNLATQKMNAVSQGSKYSRSAVPNNRQKITQESRSNSNQYGNTSHNGIYVVSDFHGEEKALNKAIEKINLGKKVIVLGDATDRGNNGLEIIKDIINMQKMGAKIEYMPGNHDEFLYDALYDGMRKYESTGDIRYLQNYGIKACENHFKNQISQQNGLVPTFQKLREMLQKDPQEVYNLGRWLEEQPLLRMEYDNGKRIALGHASFDMDLYKRGYNLRNYFEDREKSNVLSEKARLCLWYRDDLPEDTQSAKNCLVLPNENEATNIVVGHTPYAGNVRLCGKNGERTALCVDGADHRSTDQKWMLNYDSRRDNVDVTVFYPNGFPEPKDQALKGEAREWIRKRIIMKRNPNMQKNNGQNTVNKQNRLDER